MLKAVVLAAALASGFGLALLAGASPGATCTAAQKARRQAGVNAYRKRMPKDRAAYFRAHRSSKTRAAFVKRQLATLNALRRAAACTVPRPTTRPSTTTAPPPPPEPPPPGQPYSPSLAKPGFADSRPPEVTDPWVGEWGPKSDPYWIHTTGQLHALLVPVDFPDYQSDNTVAFYRDVFENTAGPWFSTGSFGRLTLSLTTIDHWVRMSKPLPQYGLRDCCDAGNIQAFFRELISILDPTVDFSTVDAIYAIGPGSSGPALNILLWRRWPGEGIVADGKELRWGVVGNGSYGSPAEAYRLAYYAMTHETGHLMGLADQYGRECNTCPDTHDWVGAWTMMDDADNGADFLAWDKWLLGWLTPPNIRGLVNPGDSYTGKLTADEVAGGVHLIFLPTGPDTGYGIEARKKLGNDVKLCGEGVLVYKLDVDRHNGTGPIRVQPARASEPSPPYVCGNLSKAAFQPGETYEDASVQVKVVADAINGYQVEVTRKQ